MSTYATKRVIKAESNPISESLRIQQLSPQTRRADLETAFGKFANIKSAVVSFHVMLLLQNLLN